MIITLKRAGTCRKCGADLEPGSRAKWYRNGAVYGLGCHVDERSTRHDTAPRGRREVAAPDAGTDAEICEAVR